MSGGVQGGGQLAYHRRAGLDGGLRAARDGAIPERIEPFRNGEEFRVKIEVGEVHGGQVPGRRATVTQEWTQW